MLISEIAESAEVLKLEECLAKYKALLAEQSPKQNYGCKILST